MLEVCCSGFLAFKNKMPWLQEDVAKCGWLPRLEDQYSPVPTLHGL